MASGDEGHEEGWWSEASRAGQARTPNRPGNDVEALCPIAIVRRESPATQSQPPNTNTAQQRVHGHVSLFSSVVRLNSLCRRLFPNHDTPRTSRVRRVPSFFLSAVCYLPLLLLRFPRSPRSQWVTTTRELTTTMTTRAGSLTPSGSSPSALLSEFGSFSTDTSLFSTALSSSGSRLLLYVSPTLAIHSAPLRSSARTSAPLANQRNLDSAEAARALTRGSPQY